MSRLRVDRSGTPAVYAIADLGALGETAFEAGIEALLDAGCRWLQLRFKGASDAWIGPRIERCLDRAEVLGAIVWINDRPDLAAVWGAPAVHLGQDDVPPWAARKTLGEAAWIGRSTHDLEQVAAAAADPDVDVVALGPIFETTGKDDPDPVVGLDNLRRARRLTEKPLVAIGGVGPSRLAAVLDAGADAAVMLGALCHGDPATNARNALALAGRVNRSC